MNPHSPTHRALPGDVFQVVDMPPAQSGWVGAFVTVDEVRAWGVVAYYHSVRNPAESGRAFLRLDWGQIEPVGRAVIVPKVLTENDPPLAEELPDG